MLYDSYDEDLRSALVDRDVLADIIKSKEYNKLIVSYYKRFASDGGSISFPSDLLLRKGNRLSACNSYWYNLLYPDHKVKDFQKTILCKDKYCSNCKRVRQSARMSKYIPYFEPFADDLFHLVLSVPNCKGDELRLVNKKLAVSFRKFYAYLSGRCKIKGFEFPFKCVGAVRSLEVTLKKDYHPHYHVALVLHEFDFDDNLRSIVNTYSYSYGILKRLFHPIEIFFQKLWRLIYEDLPISLAAIEKLELGYSCTLDHFRHSDYAELFKYMTKETKEDGTFLSYQNFIDLYFGLWSIKQIQGYGVFWLIQDSDDLEAFDAAYDLLLEELKSEKPLALYETPEVMLNDDRNLLISRKSYYKHLKGLLKNSQ